MGGWDREKEWAGPAFSSLRTVEFMEIYENIPCRDIYSGDCAERKLPETETRRISI